MTNLCVMLLVFLGVLKLLLSERRSQLNMLTSHHTINVSVLFVVFILDDAHLQ